VPATEAILSCVSWSALTVATYAVARHVHRRWTYTLTSPLLVTPCLLGLVALAAHEPYPDYFRATHWLGLMLGPAMVSFAIPIYERRELVRRHWKALATGVAAGSTVAVASAWALSTLLGLSESLRLSLLARSISTPFAVTVSHDIGGVPELTALFVIVTGLAGASLGRLLLAWMPLSSSLARGALYGMGAHSVGVATATRLGEEEGAVAGLVMILAGLANVLLAPALYFLLA